MGGMGEMVLEWDGGDLGSIEDDDILEVGDKLENGDQYWRMKIQGSEVIANVKIITSNYPCLIDELKAVFNINEKLGTHRLHYKSKLLLLIRPYLNKKSEIMDLSTLKDYEMNNMDENEKRIFKMQVQEIYTFSELLGITNSFDRSLRIRRRNTTMYRKFPISFNESKMYPEKSGKALPMTVLNRWFNDTDISTVSRRLLGVNDYLDIPIVLHNLRGNIERVINRVDRSLIGCLTPIIDRVRTRLLYGINTDSPKFEKSNSLSHKLNI